MVIHEHIEGRDPASGQVYVRDTSSHALSGSERSERAGAKAIQVVWLIAGLISLLLVVRGIFLLLGAHDVGFASFLYAISAPFVAPFAGIFPAPSVSGAYFDTAALVGIIVYSLIAWGIAALIDAASQPAES